MKYKYLLFDADNTLFDFDLAEKLAFLSLDSVSAGSFSESSYSLYHKINDDQWKLLELGLTTKEKLKIDRFREYYYAIGVCADEKLLEVTSSAYVTALGKQNELLSGAVDVLGVLHSRYDIYIITNGIAAVQRSRLTSSEISGYIKQAFISEEIGFNKPDIGYFDHVIASIGDPDKSSYLIIGDSLSSDILGATNSGIDAVYFNRGHLADCPLPVKHTISSLYELLNLL